MLCVFAYVNSKNGQNEKKIWKQFDIKWNVQFVAIIWIFVWIEYLRF